MDDDLIEDDYYAFLNVPRNATQDEINNAYRRQSRLYHPDKHVDPAKKKEAEVLFNRTKEAYKVLSNPHQRAIYDSVGISGLLTEGWEIVERTKTPQELREEYEHLAREAEERKLMMLTNPTTSVTMNINATNLFDSLDDEYDERSVYDLSVSRLEVTGMSFSQSIEMPLTLQDTVTLYGELSTHNGIGSGAINLAARRLMSPKSSIQLELGAGNGPTIGLSGTRILPYNLVLEGGFSHEFSGEERSSLISTLSMQLDTHTVGQLTYSTNEEGAMRTSIVRNTPRTNMTFSLQLGVLRSYVGFSYTYKMQERETKLRGNMKLGTFGMTVEYGAEKKISQYSKLVATVRVGIPTGVSLRIKLKRSFQTYLFPIQLSEEFIPATVFYATMVPLVSWVILKNMVLDPVEKKRAEREKEKKKEVNRTRMMEKRKEAEAATRLMEATVSRIRAQEGAKQGLIITKALYGRFVYPEEQQFGTEQHMRKNEVIDVTIPLQCLVKDSKLILYDSLKSQLPGFYDPSVGEDKQLFIQYLFRDRTHECIVKDNAPVRIPLTSHRVNTT